MVYRLNKSQGHNLKKAGRDQGQPNLPERDPHQLGWDSSQIENLATRTVRHSVCPYRQIQMHTLCIQYPCQAMKKRFLIFF